MLCGRGVLENGLEKVRETGEFEILWWQLVPSEIAEHACVRKLEPPYKILLKCLMSR